jgi:hypothetical protein
MLKRRAILTSVATLVALVVAGFLVWRSSPEFRINIEQSEIQSRVSAKLPLRSCALVVACLEIVNAASSSAKAVIASAFVRSCLPVLAAVNIPALRRLPASPDTCRVRRKSC